MELQADVVLEPSGQESGAAQLGRSPGQPQVLYRLVRGCWALVWMDQLDHPLAMIRPGHLSSNLVDPTMLLDRSWGWQFAAPQVLLALMNRAVQKLCRSRIRPMLS